MVQSIDDGDQDVADAAALEFVHHAQPELGAFAGIIARCGIPAHADGKPDVPLKLDDSSARKLASEAVKHVYQFTYPRKANEATDHQKFLLKTRERIARSFRQRFGAADLSVPDNANVYPYFVGVFDTVAALGNRATFALFSAIFVLGAAVVSSIAPALAAFFPTSGIVVSLTFG